MSDDSGLDTDVDSNIDEMESESNDNEAMQLQNTGCTSFWWPPCSVANLLPLDPQHEDAFYALRNSDIVL